MVLICWLPSNGRFWSHCGSALMSAWLNDGVRDVRGDVQEGRLVRLLLDELARLPGQGVDEVVVGARSVTDELAVLVEPVVVLRVRVSPARRAVPLVPTRWDERRVDGLRVPVQVLPEQPGSVAGVVQPRGDRRLLVPVAVELLIAAVGTDVAEHAVLVDVLAAQRRRPRWATERVRHEVVRE